MLQGLQNHHTFHVEDVPKFVAGFVLGMTGDNHLDEIETCIQGGEILATEVETAFKDIMQHTKQGYIQAGLQLAVALSQLGHTLDNCENMGDDVAAIESWATIFTDPKALASKATLHYARHRGEINTDIATVEADWNANKFFDLGKDVAALATVVIGPIESTPSVDTFTSALGVRDIEFMQYVAVHNKQFHSTEEFNFRKGIYEQTGAEIAKLNSRGWTSTHGHNKFSDWTHEEYKVLLGYKPELRTEEPNYVPYEVTNSTGIDWRTKGAVTDVKDQGQCGSCWSFSTTGALEGAHVAAGGVLTSFSEMQFVNCDYGLLKNMGCNGGLMDKAFKYAEGTAIATEEAYPYTPSKGSCDTSKLEGATLKVSSYADVTKNDSDALKAQLEKGPVSVAIEADKKAFQTYTSGVLSGDACGTSLDHGVLAVGWGTDDSGVEYYIVKNSWGPSWGLNGYINIGIESGAGVCGIQSGPPSQPVTN